MSKHFHRKERRPKHHYRRGPVPEVELAQAVNPANPNTVPKFVDPLPIPEVARPVGSDRGRPVYEIPMRQVKQQLHRDFPPTTVWGYAGKYPGPTIEARRNRPIKVHWLNELPTTHLLPVDTSIHGAEEYRPAVRNAVHLHGANTPPEFDGHPDAWYTPGLTEIGSEFRTDFYAYPNRQPATALWYHDHAVGITRLNVYAGLAGFYLLRDREEDRLDLPRGRFEIPLVIQDRTFNPDASLFYPAEWEPEFFGNTILVNGKVWPFLNVEPRKYRFRILNGSNSRFYNLKFDPALPFFQIGVDGGLLERPVRVTELLLAPAERADVILDFTGQANATCTLTNSAPAPFPGGDPPDANTGVVMQFRVVLPLSRPDRSRLPKRLVRVPVLRPRDAVRTRDLTLNEAMDMNRLIVLLGNRNLTGRPQPFPWGDSTTENPVLDTIEIWRLINTTDDTHPIHTHLVRFQILDRQPYDVDRFVTTGELVFTGPPAPPAPNERGLKDTVRANPGEVTRFIARFGDFSGPFVWHCHILEHEDSEMMRRMEIVRRRACIAFQPAVSDAADRRLHTRESADSDES
ncbi:MAG TPA: multicopper oxidase [Symbiobacteriaceae bacterium]|jgi:spore coat protein A